MNTYRSTQTIEAQQFTGEPIPDVTCGGSPDEVQAHGCDSSRKHLPHVHTQAIGGMTVLKPGDWIFPVHGGPWGVATDARFRSSWEVPAPLAAVPPSAVTKPEVPASATTFPADSPVPVVPAGIRPERLAPRLPATVDMIRPVDATQKDPVDATQKDPVDYKIRHYTDGTTASGTGLLPETSPAGAPAVSTVGENSVRPGPATTEKEGETL